MKNVVHGRLIVVRYSPAPPLIDEGRRRVKPA